MVGVEVTSMSKTSPIGVRLVPGNSEEPWICVLYLDKRYSESSGEGRTYREAFRNAVAAIEVQQ